MTRRVRQPIRQLVHARRGGLPGTGDGGVASRLRRGAPASPPPAACQSASTSFAAQDRPRHQRARPTTTGAASTSGRHQSAHRSAGRFTKSAMASTKVVSRAARDCRQVDIGLAIVSRDVLQTWFIVGIRTSLALGWASQRLAPPSCARPAPSATARRRNTSSRSGRLQQQPAWRSTTAAGSSAPSASSSSRTSVRRCRAAADHQLAGERRRRRRNGRRLLRRRQSDESAFAMTEQPNASPPGSATGTTAMGSDRRRRLRRQRPAGSNGWKPLGRRDVRRQQAQAVVAARKTLVEGAVGMVDVALECCRRRMSWGLTTSARRVSRTCGSGCAARRTQPVVNTGTLYQ